MWGWVDEVCFFYVWVVVWWDEFVGYEYFGFWGGFFWIEKVFGDDVVVERVFCWVCELLEQSGECLYCLILIGEFGWVLCALGRYDEAEQCSRFSEELGADDDVNAQMLWR